MQQTRYWAVLYKELRLLVGRVNEIYDSNSEMIIIL